MTDTDVKALLLQIDASVELLKKNLQNGEGAIDQFEKQAKAHLTSIELAFDRLGTVAEGVSNKFDTLRAGLGAIGLVLPAFVLGEMAKKGLEFAASIAEQAKQAGISAERLQELRFAATQYGVTQEGLQTTLIRLGQNLGKAELGSTKMQKAFEAVGISQVDLKNHTATVDEAFSKLSDKMHALGPSAQASGLASTLIGRSWAEAAPMLYAGSQRLNELAEAAQNLGVVLSNDQIQHAEETAHKLKEVELVLSARIAGIVADNASSIIGLATSLAQLATDLGKIDAQKLKTIIGIYAGQKIGSAFGPLGRLGGAALGGAYEYGSNYSPQDYASAANAHIHEMRRLAGTYGYKGDGSQSDLQAIQRAERDPRYKEARSNALTNIGLMHKAEKRDAVPVAASDDTGGGGANLPDFLGGKEKKKHDHTSEIARDNENKQYEIDKATLDEKKQLLEAQQKITTDTEQRNVIASDILQVDHDLKAREIEHQLQQTLLDKNATAATKAAATAQAAKARVLNDQLLVLNQQALVLQQTLADDKEREENRQAELKAETDTLQMREQLAQTAKERRAIELEILGLQYEERRQTLERIVNGRQPNGDYLYSPGERLRAGIELNGIQGDPNAPSLAQRYALQQGQILVQNATPMEQFLRSIPDTADKATEALQNVEVEGLNSITQGIADVITGTKSLGQAFHDMANQIISDLIRIALQKEIIGPLAGALFGGGGGGAGFDSFFNAVNNFGGTFAAGGDPPVGVPSLVGERGPELFIPKVPGTIVPNHALGGGAQVIYVAVDKSELFETHVQNLAGQAIVQAAPSIAAGAHGATMKALTRMGING